MLDYCRCFVRRALQEAHYRRHADHDSASLSDDAARLVHRSEVEWGEGGEGGYRNLPSQEKDQLDGRE